MDTNSAPLAPIHAAEYAVRWAPDEGGPATLDEAVAALKLEVLKSQQAEIRFVELAQPPGLPPGYRLIGRERTFFKKGGDEPEVMVKLRGPEPWPTTLQQWPPRWAWPAKLKYEVDVSWGGQVPRRALSMSLTLDGLPAAQVLTADLAPRVLPCSSRMERRKLANEVTVEQWTLPNGRVIFEVSMSSLDDLASATKFEQEVVKRLAPLRYLAMGMTELASDCGTNR